MNNWQATEEKMKKNYRKRPECHFSTRPLIIENKIKEGNDILKKNLNYFKTKVKATKQFVIRLLRKIRRNFLLVLLYWRNVSKKLRRKKRWTIRRKF